MEQKERRELEGKRERRVRKDEGKEKYGIEGIGGRRQWGPRTEEGGKGEGGDRGRGDKNGSREEVKEGNRG